MKVKEEPYFRKLIDTKLASQLTQQLTTLSHSQLAIPGPTTPGGLRGLQPPHFFDKYNFSNTVCLCFSFHIAKNDKFTSIYIIFSQSRVLNIEKFSLCANHGGVKNFQHFQPPHFENRVVGPVMSLTANTSGIPYIMTCFFSLSSTEGII